MNREQSQRPCPDFRPDESQRQVIRVQGGHHLVLAPPGCGKTQILTERIRYAHEQEGIPYEQMLCLTFTNRAARGMRERIASNIQTPDVQKVFVGNIHRFCAHFLYENNIIPAETSIIDEEDAVSILARYLDEDETQVMENATRRRAYNELIFFSHFMRQLLMQHPKELRMHPECMNSDDTKALQVLCHMHRKQLSPETIDDIYRHTDFYLDAMATASCDMGQQAIIDRLLRKMTVARQYEQYKEENRLVDFEDLLIMTYDAKPERTYCWIQVDEVQDLNPLQLAIIDLITTQPKSPAAPAISTVVYLGDEQQAIFSFMGAKLSTLDQLRNRCAGHLHTLSTNHRSPAYLLNVFNEYARAVLNIPAAYLPKPANLDLVVPHLPLRILRSNVLDTEYFDVARTVQLLTQASETETTAVIVNSNSDADNISNELTKLQLNHFKVSGEDLFGTSDIKLALAHLNILNNEHQFMAWARLIKGLHVCEQNTYARNFVRVLVNHAMLPSDFLRYDDSTFVQEFAHAYDKGDLIVFDTETTGLSTTEDDIIQIAAVRMRNGHVVEGSSFNVHIETDRDIPLMLGDIPNPIIEERRHQRLLPPDVALSLFLDYVGDTPLVAHNASFDYTILHYNLQRHLPAANLHSRCPLCFDSLKLARLLEPDLKEYKLKYLLAVLHLEGENSHLADADVLATCSLLIHCRHKTQAVIPLQRELMGQQRVKQRVATLRRQYRETYLEALKKLYITDTSTEKPALVRELERFFTLLQESGEAVHADKLHYITSYLSHDIVDTGQAHTLAEQLSRHIMEINTMKEADLCNSRTLADRIFVSTVHKAKGLEFDNVIVFDAVEDRYPSYFNRNNPVGIAEDARKFYVAMTRARKRLFIAQSLTRMDYRGIPRPRQLTRFMNPIQKYFS